MTEQGKLEGRILVTGGAGTLGRAIAARVRRDGTGARLTVFSRDAMKHHAMRRDYPEHTYVTGDITDAGTLRGLMAGHDLVIHAGAIKYIPECEYNPRHAYRVNVTGSLNVIDAAIEAGVPQILGISTDKVCWSVNSYGMTKALMERLYQEVAASGLIKVNLVRYGNVLGSTGSVIPVWRDAVRRGERPRITDPAMTRFWLTVDQAVDLIVFALGEPSGTVTIPRLPALPMARLAEYVLPQGTVPLVVGLRPGEKMHEMLLTPQEAPFAEYGDAEEMEPGYYVRLWPVTGPVRDVPTDYAHGYTSDRARELTQGELLAMLGEAVRP